MWGLHPWPPLNPDLGRHVRSLVRRFGDHVWHIRYRVSSWIDSLRSLWPPYR